jgi:pyrroline-5-carboxylate reductase
MNDAPTEAGMTQRIAFIGGGNMAASLIGGLCASGPAAHTISVADPVAARRELLQRDFGVTVVADAPAAAASADVVVLAVKPQQMAEVALALAPSVALRRPLVISIAAGIRLADLARWLGPHAAIVRTMPNRPALVGAGVTALHANANVDATARRTAENIMAACGATVWVAAESEMDIVTAVSGSGPAYFLLLIEALEDAAVELGMDRNTARLLAVETARGAGRMAAESPDSPAVQREQVTSKGGTTAAALEVLESAGVRAIFARAVAAATQRSAALAREFGDDHTSAQAASRSNT